MKMYTSVFRIRFINSLQYRAVTLGAIVTRFAWGFMEVLAYSMLYRTGNAVFPMEFSQTVSYIWMQQTLIVLFSVVLSDGEIYSAIGSGSIAYELVRPMDLYGRWFCQSAANRVAFTILNCLPALLVALKILMKCCGTARENLPYYSKMQFRKAGRKSIKCYICTSHSACL